MGQALYRKYRSRSLSEIVGQEHITETLQRAIESGRISHAYLFTGPRGVGKTSIARILAHELNGVPYDGETSHLDIIEIDAASNGGVEEVRDLRDKVHIAPSSGKYKVYIIDEVHMMTTSAFNALLKTLEEPPAHAVFILATTEAHKLPATIVSRTQRFTFKPIPRDKVVAHLRHIAGEEKIDIADDALELIAEHGGGSFRDSISMLDQAGSSGGHIDRQRVEQLLGIPSSTVTTQLVGLLTSHDVQGIASLLTALRTDGYQAGALAKQLSQALRIQILDNEVPLGRQATLTVLNRLVEVPASHNPDQLLELTLLEAALGPETAAPAVVIAAPVPAAAPAMVPGTPQAGKPVVAVSANTVVISAPQPVPELAPGGPAPDEDSSGGSSAVVTDAQWQAVLESLKKQYNTLYGIIRMARPEFLPGKIILTFGFIFHQKRANDAKNKKLLIAVLEAIAGSHIAIECKYDKTVTPPAPAIPASGAPAAVVQPVAGVPFEAISNIFGGGELLQS